MNTNNEPVNFPLNQVLAAEKAHADTIAKAIEDGAQVIGDGPLSDTIVTEQGDGKTFTAIDFGKAEEILAAQAIRDHDKQQVLGNPYHMPHHEPTRVVKLPTSRGKSPTNLFAALVAMVLAEATEHDPVLTDRNQSTPKSIEGRREFVEKMNREQERARIEREATAVKYRTERATRKAAAFAARQPKK